MISVKQDFINLLDVDKDSVVEELTTLQDFDDRTAYKTIHTVPDEANKVFDNFIEDIKKGNDGIGEVLLDLFGITVEEVEKKERLSFQDFQEKWSNCSITERLTIFNSFFTEEIENPLPLHRQKGFDEWLDVVRLNADAQGVKVSELTGEYSKKEIEAAVVELT